MAATFEKAREKAKMTTRPRRDSTSSLAAAIQAKAQKDSIGDHSEPRSKYSSTKEKVRLPFVTSCDLLLPIVTSSYQL